ncbi:MAG: sulfite exporter TauE/SafE family protein [Holophaga sp.]|nr:sulfite exporter TauE/SafE family protein [Holophaga sp.]
MNLQPIPIMLTALGAMTALFSGYWLAALRRLRGEFPGAKDPALDVSVPTPEHVALGFATNFFDTLGIGAFATTTAAFRFRKLLPDQLIPGTLNVGHCLPAILQSFIFSVIIPVDALTMILMVLASTLGAWLGAGIVSHWPKRRIQIGMGSALLGAACLMFLGQMKWVPSGGVEIGLAGWKLLAAVMGHLLLGALMTLGIGLFAPCMIMLSLLGMNPKSVFPIMMTACAFLMPVGGMRFIREQKLAPRVAIGLTLGGIPAVLVAAYLIKELPLYTMRWVVITVVVYTGTMLLRSASKPQES